MKIEMHVGTTKMVDMEVDDNLISKSELDIVTECVTAMDQDCRSELSRHFLRIG